MSEIFLLIFPVFVLILIGWILKAKNIVKNEWIKILNNFVYYVSLPALIFLSFYQIHWTQEAIITLGFHLVFLTVLSVVIFLFLSILKISPKMKASYFMLLTLTNSIYMGFPIIQSFTSRQLSEIALIPTFYLVFGMIASIIAIEIWVEKTGKLHSYIDDLLKNPLLLSLFAGIVVSLLLGGKDFQILSSPLAMIASTASPLALLTLGAFMHGRFEKKHIIGIFTASVFKLVGFPVITFIVGTGLGFGGEALTIAVLSSAMPLAVTSFVLSEKYNLEPKLISVGIIISTLFSIVTIWGWLNFLR